MKLLALDRMGCCGHLECEPVDGRSLFLSITLCFKKFLKNFEKEETFSNSRTKIENNYKNTNQSTETNLEVISMFEYSDKNIKTCIKVVFNVFKKFSRYMENIKETGIEHLEKKTYQR